MVKIARNPLKGRRFDFAPWQGVGIDLITCACQRQIERFLDIQDSDVEVATVLRYAQPGRHPAGPDPSRRRRTAAVGLTRKGWPEEIDDESGRCRGRGTRGTRQAHSPAPRTRWARQQSRSSTCVCPDSGRVDAAAIDAPHRTLVHLLLEQLVQQPRPGQPSRSD
ncbi:MAG: hypothetical protein EOP82_02980 [Variovorax sp.]|nr:MAG: hypothetical protein EOP82_02980 [Variovorax sp.]